MKFSTREDIGAAAGDVFRAVTDFAAFERHALRRGAELRRLDRLQAPGAGMSWAATFPLRGRTRKAVIDIIAYEPDERVQVRGQSDALDVAFQVTLLALSRNRTRLGVELEVRARTLPARLLLQSARLGKGNLDRRFQKRVRRFAADLEQRFADPRG